MIPRTFPSTYASNGQQQMLVHFLTDVTGLQRWSDYIPVKLTQGGTENSYANDGYIDVEVVGRSATDIPFKDYVPVYADSSASDAWQVNATGYIPYGYAGFGDAALVLDFTSPAALDPRITFSRASNATYFNSAGVLTTTGFNLLTYSEQFDNAAWTKTRASITADAIVSPDGTMDGDKLVEDTTATNSHLLTAAVVSVVSGTAYTFSFYAKSDGSGRRIQAGFPSTAFTLTTRVNFNVDTQVVTPGANATGDMISVGNGWYRCTATMTATATVSVGMFFALANTDAVNLGATTYTGDGTSGVYIWGAQLETGSAATVYIPTTSATSGAARFDYDPVTLAPKGLLIEESRTNLFLYSEQFDNAAWTKTNATITANTIVSPDGTLDGDKLVEDTSALAHQLSVAVSVVSGTAYTNTLYAKKGERTQVGLSFAAGGFGTSTTDFFDLNSGTVLTNASGTAAITAVGNGWYRVSATRTATATASSVFTIRPAVGGSGAYTGDGTSGIYVWGAQMETGAFPTSYIPTTTAAATRAADVATMIGANFSNWYNATEGTLFGDYQSSAGTNQRAFSVSDGTSTNVMNILVTNASGNGSSFAITVSGTLVAGVPANIVTQSATNYKVAGAYENNNVNGARNGTIGTTDTSAAIPTVDRAVIGAGGASTQFLNGTIKRIAYFPRRLANAELQAITS